MENTTKRIKKKEIQKILSEPNSKEKKLKLSNFANYLENQYKRGERAANITKLRKKAKSIVISNSNMNNNTRLINSYSNPNYNYIEYPGNNIGQQSFWSGILTNYNTFSKSNFKKNKEAKRLAKEKQNRLAQQQQQQNVGIINTVTSALETASTAVSNAVQNMTNPPPSPVRTVVNNHAKLRSLVNETSKKFVNLQGKLKELRGAVGLSTNISAAAAGGSKKKKRSKSKKSKSKSRK